MAIHNLSPRRNMRQFPRLAPAIFVALLAALLLVGVALMAQSGNPVVSPGDRANICNQLGVVESAGGANAEDPLKEVDDAIAALRSVLLNIGIRATDSNAVDIAENICNN